MRKLVVALLLTALAGSAGAEPTKCQKQIIKSLWKFKKVYLKSTAKCVDAQNIAKVAGPCPDAAALLKITTAQAKIAAKIDLTCPDPDITTLGYPGTCAYETTATGIEALCAALPVTNASQLASCLMCWKGAELAEFSATMYASHAVELCQGAFDETSPACTELDCASPLPDQRDLGDTGENLCQRAIAKGGLKHLLKVEKTLEKCGLLGHSRAYCLADLKVQVLIDKSELQLETLIRNKCGNRDPVPSTPFCCRTGVGNECTAAATREDCTMGGGTVQDNKVCGGGLTCESIPGGQKMTWWATCPISDTCPGTPLTTLDDLIACVDSTADEMIDEMLCIQFPSGWGPCPPDASPSGAFLD